MGAAIGAAAWSRSRRTRRTDGRTDGRTVRHPVAWDKAASARSSRSCPSSAVAEHARRIHRADLGFPVGRRLREAGSVVSMGEVASSVDNALIESLHDRRDWDTRAELVTAIFEWIEGWYSPSRRATN
jgi:hypothetical protein